MPDVRNTTRQKRLSAALRENLKRRKAQIKGRAGEAGSDPDPAPDRSGAPGPDPDGRKAAED